MAFTGFEGAAGTGKTHRLIASVRQRASEVLRPHQRVLGLTFMHGSRRRLHESLANEPETRGRFDALTVDSFANQLLRRWQSLAGSLPDATQFDAVCDAAGALLEQSHVAKWVAATFSVLVIDEAQELKPCRLRIAKALSKHVNTYVAADEFQCLDERIDTKPFLDWFATGRIENLTEVHRTDRRGLLDAGLALRDGRAVRQGLGLSIRYDYPNQFKFAVGHALNAADGTAAILLAPGAARWGESLIEPLSQGLRTSRQVVRPIRIAWETGSSEEAARVANALIQGNSHILARELPERAAEFTQQPPWLKSVFSAIEHARRTSDHHQWSHSELVALCERKANAHRAYRFTGRTGIKMMSIHAAKNRQFQDLVVLWPEGVRGSADHQRRLLYNAITRAQRSCTVFVQTRNLLGLAPFA